MNWSFLIIFLFFGTPWVQIIAENLQDATKTANGDNGEELFKKKCISSVVSKVKVCFGNHLPKKLEDFGFDHTFEEICAHKRVQIRACFSDLAPVWENCSDQEEKYFSGFISDALDAVYDYFCSDYGAVIPYFFDDNVLDCLLTLDERENASKVCDDKLKVLKDDTPDDTPDDTGFSKLDVCEDLNTTKTCYGNYLKDECPRDKHFGRIIAGFMDAISSPCKKAHRDLLE